MRYDEIRQHVQTHYRDLLSAFKSEVSANGPIEGQQLDVMRTSIAVATDDPEGFLALGYPDGIDGLLSRFCAIAGIKDNLSKGEKKLFVSEIALAFRTFSGAALGHNTSFSSIDLSDPVALPLQVAEVILSAHESYSDVVQQYLDQGTRANAWAAKTLGEKQDALALLSEITLGKSVGLLTKADARQVKDVLMRLPRNRRKMAETRDLTLADMLKVRSVDVISGRTLNAYVSNLQSFCKWAVDNGHAEVNVFEGMRIRIVNKPKDNDRKAFSEDQLRLMFRHLTVNPDALVKKDEHKWPALIAMFSGMRLNEVAQLQPDDVRLVGEVWCFDVNTNGDVNKSLKNQSSHRLVPVHQRLLDTGLLAFVEAKRGQKTARLFPNLRHSKQNGYGRNAGRWFNDSFLPALGMAKGTGLLFHCLRHTMITRLAQTSEVPEAHLKALAGHIQHGVTYTSYFKAGFLPSQLQKAVNLFDV